MNSDSTFSKDNLDEIKLTFGISENGNTTSLCSREILLPSCCEYYPPDPCDSLTITTWNDLVNTDLRQLVSINKKSVQCGVKVFGQNITNITITADNSSQTPTSIYVNRLNDTTMRVNLNFDCPSTTDTITVPFTIAIELSDGTICNRHTSVQYNCNNIIDEVTTGGYYDYDHSVMNIGCVLNIIPSGEPLKIDVCDWEGNVIVNLMNSEPTASPVSLNYDTSSLTPGTYYLVFRIANEIAVETFLK
jgi:hypothetical protein